MDVHTQIWAFLSFLRGMAVVHFFFVTEALLNPATPGGPQPGPDRWTFAGWLLFLLCAASLVAANLHSVVPFRPPVFATVLFGLTLCVGWAVVLWLGAHAQVGEWLRPRLPFVWSISLTVAAAGLIGKPD